MKHRWTKEEREFLKSDLTNSEISERLDIPVSKVRRARRYYTGHYCELTNARDTDHKGSEARILDLAKRIGVRIDTKRNGVRIERSEI